MKYKKIITIIFSNLFSNFFIHIVKIINLKKIFFIILYIILKLIWLFFFLKVISFIKLNYNLLLIYQNIINNKKDSLKID